jgi:hypothetical protein
VTSRWGRRKRGRKPRAGTAAQRRITLRVTEDEYRSYKREAIGQSLSNWARRILNKAASA